jgi:predicted HTH transcriptional regulator
MQQPTFTLEAERPAKRVQTTSIKAFLEIAPSLGKREAEAVDLIRRHPGLTARELMRVAGITDANVLRPRLVPLCDRGVIVKGEQRKCAVTGKTAFTWSVK